MGMEGILQSLQKVKPTHNKLSISLKVFSCYIKTNLNCFTQHVLYIWNRRGKSPWGCDVFLTEGRGLYAKKNLEQIWPPLPEKVIALSDIQHFCLISTRYWADVGCSILSIGVFRRQSLRSLPLVCKFINHGVCRRQKASASAGSFTRWNLQAVFSEHWHQDSLSPLHPKILACKLHHISSDFNTSNSWLRMTECPWGEEEERKVGRKEATERRVQENWNRGRWEALGNERKSAICPNFYIWQLMTVNEVKMSPVTKQLMTNYQFWNQSKGRFHQFPTSHSVYWSWGAWLSMWKQLRNHQPATKSFTQSLQRWMLMTSQGLLAVGADV